MMSEVITTLKGFLDDNKAWEMYLTGRAGTGKTTALAEVVEWCQREGVEYLVCAFTHKACSVLADKLPEGANIETLHKYLKKRPGINEHATHRNNVDVRTRMGDSHRPHLVIVDEYSMVGEQDYVDLLAMQDPHDEEYDTQIKVLYVGDPYQLPPVGDMQTINPRKPYWVQLDRVYRTENADLMDCMTKLVSMIEGAPPEPLDASQNFIRGIDLVEQYKRSNSDSKVCLAWTNKAVENLNAAIAGRTRPDYLDDLWCPTLRHEFIFKGEADNVDNIMTAKDIIPLGTKYKTLEFLLGLDYINFYAVEDTTIGEDIVIATIFGHYNYKSIIATLTDRAVEANQAILKVSGEQSPAEWARNNSNNPLAKKRSKAWRELLAVREAVLCVDFPYAMTIHKSQGSTYEEVYIDSEDLSQCGATNMDMYLKLFYVAVSRASKRVFTN
jgi:hypothetical protein